MTACDFPACNQDADTESAMCPDHRNVRVSTSWADDRHMEGGHG